MHKLSSRFTLWKSSNPSKNSVYYLPAVIVGSGYGGSVAAKRLAENGIDVTVLERGSEFLPGEFPNDLANIATAIRAPGLAAGQTMGSDSGLMEMRAGPGATSVVANGLGGGSLINAGVLMRPLPEVLASKPWPVEIGNRTGELQRYFDRAQRELGGGSYCETTATKGQALINLADAINANQKTTSPKVTASVVTQTIDHTKCTRCGDCTSGCNVAGAKITLRDSYLKNATDTDADISKVAARILTGATVYHIKPECDSVDTKWRIRVIPTEALARFRSLQEAAELEPLGAGVDIVAEALVLAAGTFGSTEILQRSKAFQGAKLPISPAVGSRFSGNGDALSFSIDEKNPVDAIGIGADSWRNSVSTQSVGATITRCIDMRSNRPLAEQIVIQDGAVPGAIAPLFGVMNAIGLELNQIATWKWRRPKNSQLEPFLFGEITHSYVNSTPEDSLDRRTQILLSMGHDESKGRIVWVGRRDASVPYWEDPENIETYQHQARILEKASKETGAKWVPTLLWKPIPEAMNALMSGPKPDKFLTTVHPLGGCVMGDEPLTSVVDHLGRVRKVHDLHATDQDVFQTLYVLDGSIVPSSLGCNPLLTITALAERSLDKSPLINYLKGKTSNYGRSAFPAAQHFPEPFERTKIVPLPVYMEERLVCADLRLSEKVGGLFSVPIKAADLSLQLEAADWLLMWSDRMHKLDVHGTLRIGSEDNWHEYEVIDGSVANLFYDEKRSSNLIARIIRGIKNIEPGIRTICTYVNLRSMDKPFEAMLKNPRRIFTMFLYGVRATEIRRMRYELEFKSTSSSEDAPDQLFLHGTKHIEYAGSWTQLWEAKRRKKREKEQLWPYVRESFFEQASNLSVRLAAEKTETVNEPKNLFLMDFKDMVERLPLRLAGGGDLPNALIAILKYPLVFSQYLIKTRIFDFRLPDYSGRFLLDEVPVSDLLQSTSRSLRVNGGHLSPAIFNFDVPLGHSSFDLPDDPEKAIKLKLLRYARTESVNEDRFREGDWYGKKVVKVKSILLVHAFGQSGYSYTHKTVEQNMAEHFYAQGYEVWVLEYRLSTSIPAHAESSTLDQMGRYDIPKAVDLILKELREDLPDAQQDFPIQFYAFSQCLGAGATNMALLSGGLSYENHSVNDGHSQRFMPKLAGLVVSQVHPHVVGQPMSQAKTWLPSMLRDALGLTHVPFAVRGPVSNMMHALVDRFFSALPVPLDERCPLVKDRHEDDCATCRRIRFLEAPLFKHGNLNLATHQDLPLLFGDANIRTFAQAAKCVETERLVTEDGANSYVTDDNIFKYANLPVCFFHGQENELFHYEGAERTSQHWVKIQPQWVKRVHDALGNSPIGSNLNAGTCAWIQPDYGHVDVLIGKNAHKEIYPKLSQAFNYWHEFEAKQNVEQANESSDTSNGYVRPRLPLNGPFIGALRRNSDGDLLVSVSFRVDDRFADVIKLLPAKPSTWAYARCRAAGKTDFRRTTILELQLKRDSKSGNPDTALSLMFAQGEMLIPSNIDVGDLELECFSVHKIKVAVGVNPPMNAFKVKYGDLSKPIRMNKYEQTFDQMMVGIKVVLADWSKLDTPLRKTVSSLRLYPDNFDKRKATLSASSVSSLAPVGDALESTSFGVGGCRYPGFRVEHRRVDAWLRNVPGNLDFALLLGDQIYADSTAGFTDALSPNERFNQRHRFAFARSRSVGGKSWFGDWLASLPVFMTPDDHEYIDCYPDGPPLLPSSPQVIVHSQNQVHSIAFNALYSYQLLQMQPFAIKGVAGAWSFESGPARFLILDTRSHRRSVRNVSLYRILTEDQIRALTAWLSDKAAEEKLNVIATGSVIAPGLSDHDNPGNPGRRDNFQCSANDRNLIFEKLHEQQSERQKLKFLLISGDYHVSAAAKIVNEEKAIVGAALVTPPLYSPMPFMNAASHSLLIEEVISTFGWNVMPVNSPPASSIWQGNGMARVKIERDTEDKYIITYEGNLWVPEQQADTDGHSKFKVTINI